MSNQSDKKPRLPGAAAPQRRLVVYVNGMSDSAVSEPLRERIQAELGPRDTFRYWDPKLRPWTRARLADLAHQLRVQLRVWSAADDDLDAVGFDQITLIGHSIGGLLVRHAYLLDVGAYGDEAEAQPWALRVSRIVLLAAPNRGFDPRRLPVTGRVALTLLAPLAAWTAEDARAGSAYVTELRLRWMRWFDKLEREGGSAPEVAQLLGDRDDIVTRGDSLDVEQFRTATHMYVPQANHAGLPDLSKARDPEERWRLLRHAIFEEIHSSTPPTPYVKETVAFLLHGIRAGKDTWVHELEQKLKESEPGIVTYGPSYGYFSAISFAIPWTRQQNLRSFLDNYSDLYARHRGNAFHFVGHSNGTYVLGQALQAVPAVEFSHVYLAGSVLPRTYPWMALLARGQARMVRNDRADHDYPVAWLCSALRGLGMDDVGTGGFDGFDQSDARIDERYWFHGGHGTCVGSTNQDSIRDFVLQGISKPSLDGRQSFMVTSTSRALAVLAPVAAVGVTAALTRWTLAARPLRRVSMVAAAAGMIWAVGKVA